MAPKPDHPVQTVESAGRVRFLLILTVILAVSTTLPYLLAYIGCPEGKVYSGIHTINSGDLYQYLALARQAEGGRILMEVPYTIEPEHTGLMLRPIFLIVGAVTALFRLPLLVSFHLVRLLALLFMVIAADRAAGVFLHDDRTRKIFLLILVFSSGFGWFTAAVIDSCDEFMPESVAFLGCLESPHFPVSLALMFLALTLGAGALENGKPLTGLAAGCATALLALIHPFDLPVLGVLLGALFLHSLLQPRNSAGKRAVLAVGISISIPAAAGVLAVYLPTMFDPVLAWWRQRNIMPSPPPLFFLRGFGPHLLLLLPGVIAARHYGVRYRGLLLAWIAVTFLLMYSPLPFQRRAVEGVQIPLSIFAAAAVSAALGADRRRLGESGKRRLRRVSVAVLVLMLFLPGNLKILANDIREPRKEDTVHPFYLSESWIRAMRWLGERSMPGDGVLASRLASSYLPGFTDCRVPWGHHYMSVLFPETGAKLKLLLDGKLTPREEIEFYREYGIRFLFFDPPGAATIFSRYNPGERKHLKLIYFESDAFIYCLDAGQVEDAKDDDDAEE